MMIGGGGGVVRGAALEWRGVCRLFAPLRIVATALWVVAACAEGQCACTPPVTEAVPHALPSTTPNHHGHPQPPAFTQTQLSLLSLIDKHSSVITSSV